MGLFDRFRRRGPTGEQAARLKHITNAQQRAALLKAIADGDAIPEYAWEPIPEELDPVAMVLALQPIVTCAETLRATATAASHYLSDAIECPALASAPVFSELLAWGYFNPFGPTTCSLFLVDVPTADEQIIFFRWLNPFATGATAYGLVPNTVAGNPQQLASVLERLFAGGAQERSTSPRQSSLARATDSRLVT